MVASTSSATRLTNTSGASCANASGARNVSGAASINNHLRIIFVLVIGISLLGSTPPKDTTETVEFLFLPDAGTSLFHLGRRFPLVELVATCTQIGIAQ